ncbi:hypothetical protein QVD99_006213 [Batrachochytrium dendrobatidis]|nr:hypothetical protein QVD99_006213 [Batrachochytrium dendrobatidis]
MITEGVPSSYLVQPGFLIVFQFVIVIILTNIALIAYVLYTLSKKNQSAKSFKIAIILLNMIAVLLQIACAFSTYSYSLEVCYLCNIYEISLALCLGGMCLLQLEVRFIFDILFSNSHTATWSDFQKIKLRAIVISLHLLLCWPEYLHRVLTIKDSWYITWWIGGLGIQSVILACLSVFQAYSVINALLKTTRRRSSKYVRIAHRLLMTAIILVIVLSFASWAASIGAGILLRKPDIELNRLGTLGDQLSVSGVAFEVLFESIALLVMIDLVSRERMSNSSSTTMTEQSRSIQSHSSSGAHSETVLITVLEKEDRAPHASAARADRSKPSIFGNSVNTSFIRKLDARLNDLTRGSTSSLDSR